MFHDANFIGPGKKGRAHAKAIADELIGRNIDIYFSIACRANDIEDKLFAHLIKAGLRHVFVGIESFCSDTLKLLNKGVSVECNLRALDILNRLGIDTQVGFIMYHPYVTIDEIQKNTRILKKTRNASMFNIGSCLNVYHGTPIEESLEDNNLLKRRGWEIDFKFVNRDAEALYRITKKIFAFYHPIAFTVAMLEDPICYEWRRPYNNNLTKKDSKRIYDFEMQFDGLFADFILQAISKIKERPINTVKEGRDFCKYYAPKIDKLKTKSYRMAESFLNTFILQTSYYKYDHRS
jgi:radical SAM superfamily enzyme YgiQ (UPF0313 family)